MEDRRADKPESPDSVRATETRRHILDAAEQVILSEGSVECGLDAIVRASGYSKGALYHHFSGKSELQLAVIQERLLPQVEKLLDLSWLDLEASPKDVVMQIAGVEPKDLDSRACRLLYQAAARSSDKRVRELCTHLWDSCHARIVSRLTSSSQPFNAHLEQMASLLMLAAAGRSLLQQSCRTANNSIGRNGNGH